MIALMLYLVYSSAFIRSISATTYICDPTLACGCSAISATVTSRIVGGEAAPDHAWSWIASLQKNDSHICGATLLSSEYAVTAAHCLEDVLNNPSILSIIVGTNHLNNTLGNTVQRRTITKIVSHPYYDSNFYKNDIAIIGFSPLTISSNSKLALICLPEIDKDPFDTSSSLVAIGWGYLHENIEIASNSLRQVTLQVYSSTSNECLRSGLKNSTIQFCAGVSAGGKDTCQGDSGGPLMAFVNNRWVLAGVTSAGFGCARVGQLGLYTRVSAFLPFIDSSMPISPAKPTENHGNSLQHNFILISIISLNTWIYKT